MPSRWAPTCLVFASPGRVLTTVPYFCVVGFFRGINTPVFATSALKRKVLFKHPSETQFKAAQHPWREERSLRGERRVWNKAAWCVPTNDSVRPDVEGRRYL